VSATFAIIVATYGDPFWKWLANERAIPSARIQSADELLHHHDPNGQRHQVRNELARQARSDWLVFLDADDHLAAGYIDAMRAAAPAPGTKALLNPAVGPRQFPEQAGLFAPKDLRDGNYMVIGTAVPRALFLEVGGFWDWDGFEDWELWIRCEKAGATVIQVPGAVYLIDSTERSRDATATHSQTGRWFMEIRKYHWPEQYGRSGKRRVGP
jgi:GT2 family glycosyltransferase